MSSNSLIFGSDLSSTLMDNVTGAIQVERSVDIDTKPLPFLTNSESSEMQKPGRITSIMEKYYAGKYGLRKKTGKLTKETGKLTKETGKLTKETGKLTKETRESTSSAMHSQHQPRRGLGAARARHSESHQNSVGSKTETPVLRETRTKKVERYCKKCQRNFAEYAHPRCHLRVQDQIACPFCDFLSRYQYNLNMHLRVVHNKSGPLNNYVKKDALERYRKACQQIAKECWDSDVNLTHNQPKLLKTKTTQRKGQKEIIHVYGVQAVQARSHNCSENVCHSSALSNAVAQNKTASRYIGQNDNVFSHADAGIPINFGHFNDVICNTAQNDIFNIGQNDDISNIGQDSDISTGQDNDNIGRNTISNIGGQDNDVCIIGWSNGISNSGKNDISNFQQNNDFSNTDQNYISTIRQNHDISNIGQIFNISNIRQDNDISNIGQDNDISNSGQNDTSNFGRNNNISNLAIFDTRQNDISNIGQNVISNMAQNDTSNIGQNNVISNMEQNDTSNFGRNNNISNIGQNSGIPNGQNNNVEFAVTLDEPSVVRRNQLAKNGLSAHRLAEVLKLQQEIIAEQNSIIAKQNRLMQLLRPWTDLE